jgi:hypothetical protein
MSPPPERSGGIPVLRDIDGIPIVFHCKVEQVTVDEEDEQRGALFSELHQRGEVLGWDTHLLYVRLERDGHTVALRPDLVRVLTTDGG